MALREQIERHFQTSEVTAAFLTDKMTAEDALQRLTVEFHAFALAVRGALTDIAAEIDKLAGTQTD